MQPNDPVTEAGNTEQNWRVGVKGWPVLLNKRAMIM